MDFFLLKLGTIAYNKYGNPYIRFNLLTQTPVLIYIYIYMDTVKLKVYK